MQEEKLWNEFMKDLLIDKINNFEWKNIKSCTIDAIYNGKDYLEIPESIEEIVFGPQFNDNINNLVIPRSVNKIYFQSEFCQNISELKINDNVILIFYKINKITAESLPNNIKYIGIVELTFPLINLPSSLEWVATSSIKLDIS